MAEAAEAQPDDLSRPKEKHGRFDNPWPTWKFPSMMDFFRLLRNPPVPSIPKKEELNEKLPVLQPSFPAEPNREEVRATWLGHASVLFQLDGAAILCDPVFSNRCSPSSYVGPKRYRPPPCKVDDLPHVDAVVISHTHYDHLDYSSVVALHKRFPDLHWFVPRGCEGWMRSCGPKNVRELTWWEEAPLGERTDFRVVFTPTQHWSGRGVFDRNKALWGSWALVGPEHRAWFAGDTGYCSAFKEIGQHLGPFDIAAIPIGAYEPRWFMSPQHVDPEQAVQIHQDVGAKLSLAIHWGTFPQAGENVLEPPIKLLQALKDAGLQEECFRAIRHGDTIVLNGKIVAESET